MVLFFIVKIKFDKNQTKLGVTTLNYNVPKDYILHFVVEFIEEVFPILEIKEPKKKKEKDSNLIILCLNYLFMLKSNILSEHQ